MLNPIIVYHHLGLGDHFICNGLVNDIAERIPVYLICKDTYFPTISCLYGDNFAVKPIAITNSSYESEVEQVKVLEREMRLPLYTIGFANIDHTRFDQNFYEFANIPFEYRYTKFKLPKFTVGAINLFTKLYQGQEYILAHTQSSEGSYDINIESDLPIIYVNPNETNNMMNWCDLIKYATEIHCIPSSFYCLVDSMANNIKAKLFYHSMRRGTLLQPNNQYNNNRWNIIEYATKL